MTWKVLEIRPIPLGNIGKSDEKARVQWTSGSK